MIGFPRQRRRDTQHREVSLTLSSDKYPSQTRQDNNIQHSIMELILGDSSIIRTTPPAPHNNHTVTKGDDKHTNKNITITVTIFAPKKTTTNNPQNKQTKSFVTVSLHIANSTGSTEEGRREYGNMPVELNGIMKCISRGQKIQTHKGEQAITVSIKVS